MVDGDGRVSGRHLGQALYAILSNLAVLGFWTAVFVLARALGEIFAMPIPSLLHRRLTRLPDSPDCSWHRVAGRRRARL